MGISEGQFMIDVWEIMSMATMMSGYTMYAGRGWRPSAIPTIIFEDDLKGHEVSSREDWAETVTRYILKTRLLHLRNMITISLCLIHGTTSSTMYRPNIYGQLTVCVIRY